MESFFEVDKKGILMGRAYLTICMVALMVMMDAPWALMDVELLAMGVDAVATAAERWCSAIGRY